MSIALTENERPMAGYLTWEEALQEFLYHLKANRAPQTLRFYRVQLSQAIRWCNANQIPFGTFGKRHLDRYLSFRKESCVCAPHSTIHCRAFSSA